MLARIVQALDVAGRRAASGPEIDHPAGAEAGHPVRLRQPVEGQARAGRGRATAVAGVRRVVVQDLVVDLVGEDQQVVPAGELDELLEHRPRRRPRRSGCSG